MRLAYRLVNVFTQNGGRLTGNPLCVFENGRGVADAQMQALALQLNLSETTFILPSDRADARVRIFTPGYELSFAGHPTLGTAHVVRSLQNRGNQVSLELGAGVIPVCASGDRWELRAASATTRAPKASRAQLATALGLAETDIAGRVLWADLGSEMLIIPLASAAAVKKAKIIAEALTAATLDAARPKAYLFANTGNDTLLARFFFPKSSAIDEDPATGGATACLGAWYVANDAPLPMAKTISQGEMVGRPSTLHLRIDAARNVFVAGEVVEIGGGYVDL